MSISIRALQRTDQAPTHLMNPFSPSPDKIQKAADAAFEAAGLPAIVEDLSDKIEKLRMLLRSGGISNHNRGQALELAVKSGSLSLVDQVFESGDISQAYREKAIRIATEKSHTRILEVLLTHGSISDDERDFVLKIAIKTRDIASINILLANGFFKSELQGKYLIWGAVNGYLSVIETLLSQKTFISEKDQDIALTTAAKNGSLEIVECLVKKGSLSCKAQGFALTWAAYHGSHAIVNLLLQNHSIADRFKYEAIAIALSKEDFLMVHLLIDESHTTPEDEQKYLCLGSAQGYHLLVEALVLRGNISDQSRGIAIKNAAINNHLDIIKTLLANNATISQLDRSEAIKLGISIGSLEIVNVLLDSGPISIEERGKAVILAAQIGNLEIIKALLGKDPTISDADRGIAIMLAAQNGYLEIIENLLANDGTISEEDRGKAVSFAAKYGHLNVVEALILNGHITPEYQQLAAELATDNDHLEIVDFLIQNYPTLVIGLDVHSGDRDEQTKAAIIKLYEHQGSITKEQIDKGFDQVCDYLESEKEPLRSKALQALLEKQKAGESFGPFVSEESLFTVLGHPIDGKEFMARLWIFINNLGDMKDRSLALYSMASALADSVLPDGNRVCNQGKIQRLITSVLQGRLFDIQIESGDIGAQKLTLTQSQNLFFMVPSRQKIRSLKRLLEEATLFCDENPLVNKKEFLQSFIDHYELLGLTDDRTGSIIGDDAITSSSTKENAVFST